MKKLGVYILLMCFAFAGKAQDLNARVRVMSGKIQTTNTHIFQSLETAIKDFLNGRKWTSDNILPNERIECNFVVNITNWDGNSNFTGELQIQSTRPVYNSSYNTPVLNINDKDFDFVYTEGQTIDYTDQSYQNNLTSVLAFYAYVIVGMDYDTFSRLGGTPYFNLAQTVVTNAQAGSGKGWKAFDGNVNRYWLSENLNSKAYTGLREFTYDYHRNGLDQMADNAAKGRKAIADALPALQQVDRTRLGAMLPLLFFTAKNSELISIFTKGDNHEKTDAINILSQADPANGNKYLTIKTSN
jgi:hypothetical protein